MRAWWHSYDNLSQDTEVGSPAAAVELFRLVDGDRRVGHVLMEFIHDSHASMSAGAGADWSVLCFQQSPDPPYFWSVGGDAPVGTLVDFSYGGSYSDYEARQLVTKAATEAAIREFVATGERPSSIDWEEV